MNGQPRRVLAGQKEKASVKGILEEEEHLAFTYIRVQNCTCRDTYLMQPFKNTGCPSDDTTNTFPPK